MSNSFKPAEGSWLDRIFGSRPHPDSFVCGLRVLDGTVASESARWKYRSSAVDGLLGDGIVTLHHGTGNTLRLRMDSDPTWDGSGPGPRTGYRVMSASVAGSDARVLLAVPAFHLFRFGVDDGMAG